MGGELGVSGVLLLISIIFGYVARHSWYAYQRARRSSEKRKALRWSVVYSLIAIATGAYLVLIDELCS